MNYQEPISEVAWLMRQIRQEYEAAHQGLHGLSQGSSQHDFISARIQRMGEHHEVLKTKIGEQQATQFLARVWNQEAPSEMEAPEAGQERVQ